MLLLAALCLAHAGAAEVVVVPKDGVVVGVDVPGERSVEWLARLYSGDWMGHKGYTNLQIGDAVHPDSGAWITQVQTAATTVADRQDLRLYVEIGQIRAFTGDTTAWARLDGRWQVDGPWGQVGYGILSGTSTAGSTPDEALQSAFDNAIQQVVASEPFTTAWRGAQATPATSPKPLQIRRCAAPAANIGDAVHATVLVRTDRGGGAGVVVSPDGYVVTAAHVLRGAKTITVRLDDNSEHAATLTRLEADADVALLKLDTPPPTLRCAAARESAASAGEDLFAIGSPGGDFLAFSVAKGIVSGVREVGGVHLVQTDVAVSPGYSGGPLVDHEGRWIGVISFKIVAAGAEGLSFGVAATDALAAIQVTLGDETVELKAP